MKKTKIVCTLGPATDDDNVLRELIKSGMDCARFNFSHGTHEDHKKRYEQVERIRKELRLLICTPKVRHIWRCIFLWAKQEEKTKRTRQNSKSML